MKELQHFGSAPPLEKLLENQSDPVLHFLIRIEVHDVSLIAHQTDRQHQGQLASLRLVQQTGREACPDGEEFNFGELAFQPQEDSTVRGGRIIDAVVVGNEAAPVAAQV